MLGSAPHPGKDGCRTDVRMMDRRPCLIPAPLPAQALLSKNSVTTALLYESFACVYSCVTHVYSDLRGQKRVLGISELELPLVVSCRCSPALTAASLRVRNLSLIHTEHIQSMKDIGGQIIRNICLKEP